MFWTTTSSKLGSATETLNPEGIGHLKFSTNGICRSGPRRAVDSHLRTTSHDCEVTLVYDTGYSGGVARQAHVHAVLAGVVGTEVEARLTDSSWPAAANTIWSQR